MHKLISSVRWREEKGREEVGDEDKKDEEEDAVIWRSHTMQTQVSDRHISSAARLLVEPGAPAENHGKEITS